jgi:hypothetical protein
VPDTWCIDWASDEGQAREQAAAEFHLDEVARKSLGAWVTARFGTTVFWPRVVLDLATARELVSRFLSHVPDIRILEMALDRESLAKLAAVAEPPPPEPGYAPMGRQGVYEVLLKGRAPTAGGVTLGFEPMSFDICFEHSWRCNALEIEIDRELGIRPNEHGLIGTWEQAQKSVEYIRRDDVGAEPGLWLPWLVIDQTQNASVGC